MKVTKKEWKRIVKEDDLEAGKKVLYSEVCPFHKQCNPYKLLFKYKPPQIIHFIIEGIRGDGIKQRDSHTIGTVVNTEEKMTISDVVVLNMACEINDIRLVEDLLCGKKWRRKYLGRALGIACKNGYEEIVGLLISKGASVSGRVQGIPGKWTRNGSGPRIHMCKRCKGRMLHEHLTDMYPLLIASEKGHLDVVELLLAKGADVNDVNDEGESAFWLAGWGNHLDVVELLLAKGADVNDVNDMEEGVLYEMCFQGDINMVELLLAKGADVNLANGAGESPLWEASSQGWVDIVKLLLSKGAHVNQANRKRRTPLYRAAERGHKDVVEVLLSYGAEVHVPRKYPSPMSIAIKKGHSDIIDILTLHSACPNTPSVGDREQSLVDELSILTIDSK